METTDNKAKKMNPFLSQVIILGKRAYSIAQKEASNYIRKCL